MMTIPLCKDCKHFMDALASCGRPIPIDAPDLVYGFETRPRYESANRERRKRGFFEFGKPRCGPEGRFFEAIEAPGCPKDHKSDLDYGMAEGTIDRYQRVAQEMQQIRKEEWED